MKKGIIYIASPYTIGDHGINVRTQMKAFNKILDVPGVIPFSPLLNHFQHISFPREEKVWIEYGLAMIPYCSACLSIKSTYEPMGYEVSESAGVDREVQEFMQQGKPVFKTVEEVREWANLISCT